MRRVVSVSLGTSSRDKKHETEILGEQFSIERRGVDGDLAKFKATFEELDGVVDALGVGGADIWVVVGDRKYAFRQIKSLISGVKTTPIADGSGLKHTLEREAILSLNREGIVDFANEKVLLVSAVDRFGMAQSLASVCPNVVFGDICFGIGPKIPVRTLRGVQLMGRLLLPIVTNLPFKWFYPTGAKQKERVPKHPSLFNEATVICGDWHYIRRYSPDRLDGKTIITQTLRKDDLEMLKNAGAARAITTTPVMGGETFATNVMEGVICALLRKKPQDVAEQEYLDVLKRLDWKPNVIPLQGD
jgi:hypothetical protein